MENIVNNTSKWFDHVNDVNNSGHFSIATRFCDIWEKKSSIYNLLNIIFSLC